MKMWLGLMAVTLVAIGAGSVCAQTSAPVLGNFEEPYAVLQSNVTIAGHTYGPGAVAYGPAGTPLVLTGANLGASGTVQFVPYKNGVVDTNISPVQATVTSWSSSMLSLTVPSGAVSGLVTVTVEGQTSINGLPFMVTPGTYSDSCPAGPTQSQLQIVTSSLSDGTVNQAYSAQLGATGGTKNANGKYGWSITNGSLPSGLSLSASGLLSGTPTSSGSVYLTIQVTDSSSPSLHDQAVLSFKIQPAGMIYEPSGVYNYSANYDPVGNVSQYTDTIMGTWGFSYDSLNRLKASSATWPDGTPQYSCWQYDSFGNRTMQNLLSNSCSTQSASTWVYGANNRVTGVIPPSGTSASASPSPLAYDQAGNVLSDTGTANQYLYDAEGRICAVSSPSVFGGNTLTGYLYDADGTRTSKGTITAWSCDPTTNGFQFTENYVLGPGGEELTMYDGQGNWQRTNVYAGGKLLGTYDTLGLHFHLTDPLGTRRMQLSGNLATLGQPETDIQSLPFGDGLNSFPDYYASFSADDSTPLHFTGKERDSESGNDYFEARYYSSSMGRFMSPDEPVDQHPADPQSWNLYSYVRNNPLTLTDPTGDYACGQMTKDQCTAFGNMLTQAQTALDAANKAGLITTDQYNAATNAVGAYGTLGDGNGVTVNVGATGGYPGVTNASSGGEKTAANPTGQVIDVTFNGKAFDKGSSPGLLGTIAHEGSHVGEAEAWAKAGFTNAANPTKFDTESRAFGVTATMAQVNGDTSARAMSPKGDSSMVFWRSTDKPFDNNGARTRMIHEYYPKWAQKAFGENTNSGGGK
jgi:RHS repeat-associated protein